MPSSYQVVLWKQESFVVLRPFRIEFFRNLLGLVHGHWDLPVSFSATEQAEAVNMGVSIIVPAKKILEVLYHPELAAMRKQHYDKLVKSDTQG